MAVLNFIRVSSLLLRQCYSYWTQTLKKVQILLRFFVLCFLFKSNKPERGCASVQLINCPLVDATPGPVNACVNLATLASIATGKPWNWLHWQPLQVVSLDSGGYTGHHCI